MRSLIAPLLVAAAAAQQPNVIFILLDDLGSADVSFYRNMTDLPPTIQTPGIDYLANSGIRLKQYYTHHTCSPTRVAFLTGRYHTNVGNPFPALGGAGSLPKYYKTIANELSERGYRNYYVGKWGVDGNGGKNAEEMMPPGGGWGPTERGFDEFYGLIMSAHDHYSKLTSFEPIGSIDICRWYKGGPHNNYPEVDPEPDMHSTKLFTREAISYVRKHVNEHAEKPFFLQLSYTAPHDPLQSEPQWMENPSCRGIDNWRRKTYCGMVVGIDEGIANLTRELTSSGVDLDNTIIIFSSDNGGAPIVGGINAPFRGAKAGSWEGSCRVAGFIRAPGAHLLGAEGRIWNGLAHVADWAPTILSLVDGGPGNHSLLDEPVEQGPIDGIDLSAALRESGPSPRMDALLMSEMWTSRNALVMQRDQHMWKLVMGYTGENGITDVPTGTWSYDDGSIFDSISELYRDALMGIMGVEYFGLEWAFYFLMKGLESWATGVQEEKILLWAADSPVRRLDSIEGTVPIAEVIPVPELDKIGVGLWLFDLATDPTESENLAKEHPDIVTQMAARVEEIIENAPPQMGAIQMTFQYFMIGQVAILSIIFCCPCCCCVCWKCRSKTYARTAEAPGESREIDTKHEDGIEMHLQWTKN